MEGSEANVLAGARETIETHRPALLVECNRPSTGPDGLIKTIAEMGYQAWGHISAYFNPDNFFANDDNQFANFAPEANLLCLPDNADAQIQGLVPVDGLNDDWRKAVARVQGGEGTL